MLDLINSQKNRLENWLLSDIGVSASRLDRFLWHLLRICYAVARDVAQGKLTLRAMSLVYTTILSVVPLLALTFSMLRAFNVQEKLAPMMEQFFEPMGEKGMEIHSNVLQFVENMNVGVLGALGLAMLFYTVMSLIHKIEEALNTIWYAPGPRSMARRFSNYLSAIFLGPLAIMLAVSLTAATKHLPFVESLASVEPFGTLFLFLTKLAPLLTIVMGFFFFYLLMPNAKVNLKAALLGAVVAGAAWQLMSHGFTSFVVGSTRYDAVYSGFAVGIVLLIWLYLNWLILLVGSSIAFYYQHGNYITRHDRIEICPELSEELALKIMSTVASAYDRNEPPVMQSSVESIPFIPGALTRKIVDRLIEAKLLLVVGDKSEQLAPARSTDRITLADIYRAIRKDHYDLHHHLNVTDNLREQSSGLNRMIYDQLGKTTLRELCEPG